MFRINKATSGISLIEVMLAVSIVAAMVVAIGFSITTYVDARARLLDDTKALYLAEEGYEVLRAIRSNDWNDLDALTLDDYNYLDVSTTTADIGTSLEVIDGEFYRSFILREVYRDSDDDVTSSTTPGATVDTEILEVTIYVAGPNGTTSLTGLLANIHAI